jgi:undecaprenyl diphosphate synthase
MNRFGLELDPARLPKHVGIIMDGNGRWAKNRRLPRVAGHEKGYRVLKDVIECNREIGVSFISVFTFSTENWTRPESEVNFLMDLARKLAEEYTDTLLKNDIRLMVTGTDEKVPVNLSEKLKAAAARTSHCRAYTLNIVFNYGGRKEIVDAAKVIARKAAETPSILDTLDEESFREYLYHPDIPDLDLMIRTSGEKRISNFLLWEISYSELYFTDKYWPDFEPKDFWLAVSDYQNRMRRFGNIG